jgi:SAM-dependent methyltransferase
MKRCLSCERRFAGQSWVCPACGLSPPVRSGIPRFAAPLDNDGFDRAAFDMLATLEHGSFWFRSRNRLLSWALQQYFPAARSLFEIGCGTGYVLEGLRQTLPRLRLVGGELHGEGLRHASQRLRGVELLQLDARSVPFDGEFDVVGAFDVLEHIEEDELVLKQLFTATKPGGGIIVTVPQHPWLWSASDEYGEHKRRYRRAELVAKATATGFEVRRVTSFVSLLLPAMAVVRLLGRVRPPDPFSELQPTRADPLLERVLDLERSLLTRGRDLPFGGSLLLVATRP